MSYGTSPGLDCIPRGPQKNRWALYLLPPMLGERGRQTGKEATCQSLVLTGLPTICRRGCRCQGWDVHILYF